MKRVLLLLPKNAKEKIIFDDFASGFEANKCKVIKKTINELTTAEIEKFNPDIIFGYKYSFLTDENCTKIIKKSNCKNLVFYFISKKDRVSALDEKLKKLKTKFNVNCVTLPPAINFRKHLTDFSGYKYCISVTGNLLSGTNQLVLCELIKTYKKKIAVFSSKNDFSKSVEQIKEKKLLNNDELEIYSNCWKGAFQSKESSSLIDASNINASKININLDSNPSQITLNALKALAAGGFLLTQESEELKKILKPSKHLETFKISDNDCSDLIDKIDFYLTNLNLAQKIAQFGKYETLKYHTFNARARSILEGIA